MILDSLSNGIKELFAALGAKTSDSNYAVPLLNKTNGTPLGMMDMSSLASVLGATNIRNRMAISDMNEQWVNSMEQSFQNAGNATFFSGYNAASVECAWFGFKMYNNYATLIVFRGYSGDYIAKGQRGTDGNWTFYKFLGGF